MGQGVDAPGLGARSQSDKGALGTRYPGPRDSSAAREREAPALSLVCHRSCSSGRETHDLGFHQAFEIGKPHFDDFGVRACIESDVIVAR